MITDKVINEIYKTYKKPHTNREELNLPHYLEILKKHHNINHIEEDDEIIIEDLEEFNPFRRFLVRSLHAILDFDKIIAFVFPNHILFMGKNSSLLRVHLKPEEDEKKSFLKKIFG